MLESKECLSVRAVFCCTSVSGRDGQVQAILTSEPGGTGALLVPTAPHPFLSVLWKVSVCFGRTLSAKDVGIARTWHSSWHP